MKDSDPRMMDSELKETADPADDGEAPLKNTERPERRQGKRRSGVERRDTSSIGTKKRHRRHPNRRWAGRRTNDNNARH